MSLCIGRISYLPDDPRLRDIRLKAEEKSLHSILEIKPDNVPIFIVSQNWPEKISLPEETELKEHAMQERLNFPPLGPAKARNILLEKFYKSDFDYMLMADDDISLYPYYGVNRLLYDLDKDSAKFIQEGVHCLKAVEPMYVPFKKINAQLPMKEYYLFCQAPMTNGGGLFVIVNFKKHFDKEIYFDEGLSVMSRQEREDIDFFIRLMKDKFNVLESRNMIQKNLGFGGDRSTVYSGEEDINNTANAAAQNTAIKHGIPVVNNRVQFAKVLKFYKGWLKIKRSLDWEGEMQPTNRMVKKPKRSLI